MRPVIEACEAWRAAELAGEASAIDRAWGNFVGECIRDMGAGDPETVRALSVSGAEARADRAIESIAAEASRMVAFNVRPRAGA